MAAVGLNPSNGWMKSMVVASLNPPVHGREAFWQWFSGFWWSPRGLMGGLKETMNRQQTENSENLA